MIIKNNKVTLEKGDRIVESPKGSFPIAMLTIDHITVEFAYAGDKKFRKKTPMTTAGNAYPERLDQETDCHYRIWIQQEQLEEQDPI